MYPFPISFCCVISVWKKLAIETVERNKVKKKKSIPTEKMSNLSDLEKLRQNYLKMVVHTLKENVKKTSDLDLDDFAITHYAMKVEENCLDKSRGVASYTKAITEARLNIERHTSNNTLVPLIAKSMHVDGDDSEVDTVAAKNNNGNYEIVCVVRCDYYVYLFPSVNNNVQLMFYFHVQIQRNVLLVMTMMFRLNRQNDQNMRNKAKLVMMILDRRNKQNTKTKAKSLSLTQATRKMKETRQRKIPNQNSLMTTIMKTFIQ